MRLYSHHRALFVFSSVALLALSGFAQTKNSKVTEVKTTAQQPTLTVASVPLSQYEQQLLDEINSARTNPAAYVSFLLEYRTYYHEKSVRFPDGRILVTNEGVAALDEAIAFVRSLNPIAPLEVRRGMMSGA